MVSRKNRGPRFARGSWARFAGEGWDPGLAPASLARRSGLGRASRVPGAGRGPGHSGAVLGSFRRRPIRSGRSAREMRSAPRGYAAAVRLGPAVFRVVRGHGGFVWGVRLGRARRVAAGFVSARGGVEG